MVPESLNGIRQDLKVAEIIENCRKNQEHDKKRPASEIAVSDSRCKLFWAFAGDQVCLVGPKNRNGTRMQPENFCEMQQDENWELLWNATGWEEVSVSTVNLSFLSNFWPLLSPVLCFRTKSTCLNAYKGQKYSAARITLFIFSRVPPLLSCARAQ
jgi:hypothetical protein